MAALMMWLCSWPCTAINASATKGLLPGLFCHNGELKRVHWSTAFFVSADYRGEGVAGCLLEKIKKLNIDFPGNPDDRKRPAGLP